MWPTLNEIKISELSWYPIEEDVLNLREIGMLEYMYYVKTCIVIQGGHINWTLHKKCGRVLRGTLFPVFGLLLNYNLKLIWDPHWES